MEWFESAYSGGARNLSSRLGGEMGTFSGKDRVGLGEGGLDV